MITLVGMPSTPNARAAAPCGSSKTGKPRDLVLAEERLHRRRAAAVRRQRQHGDVGRRQRLRQRRERRHLGDAGRAPGGPEIDHHAMAAELRQVVLSVRRHRRTRCRAPATGGSTGFSAALRSCRSCARGLRGQAAAARVPPAAVHHRPAGDQSHDGPPSLTDDPQRRNAAANVPNGSKWGGRFAAGPSLIMQEINASIGFDRKLWRQDIRGSLAHAAMLAKIGVLSAEDEQAIRDGLEAIAHEIESGRVSRSMTALEDIHMNIEARLTERIGEAGTPAAHRAQPQRPGGDGFPPVGARCDRRAGRAARRPDAGAGRTRGGACGRPDARLHPSADRAAGDVRPPPAGLCRNAGARPRPAGRCRRAAERVPAGRGGAGRHVVPDRPADDRGGAGLRPADGQFAGRRVGPRFRAGVPVRGGDLRDAPVALRRGDRHLVQRALRLHPAVGRVHHRQLDHAAEAQSGRGGAGAGEDRAGHRRAGRRC